MNDISSAKPLPVITDLTRPFWDAARQGRLVMQKCAQCGTSNFHPKPWCIECGSRELVWTATQPLGSVYSYTVSRSVAMNSPVWAADLPVILCLVDVDDGARMYAQVTHCKPDEIHVGMRVQVYFEPLGDGIAIPKFRPVQPASPAPLGTKP
jgi:uncharacterized protein